MNREELMIYNIIQILRSMMAEQIIKSESDLEAVLLAVKSKMIIERIGIVK